MIKIGEKNIEIRWFLEKSKRTKTLQVKVNNESYIWNEELKKYIKYGKESEWIDIPEISSDTKEKE